MSKFLIALAAAAVAVAPAAAQREGKVQVNVSGVLNKLELDLNAVALTGNVVRVPPPVAAAVCNMTTSQLSYQYEQVGNMNCKAVLVSKALKKAAKEQAVAKTAAPAQ